MLTRALPVFFAVAALWGCAHKPLSGGALDEVRRPAFISRIEENAGPKSEVFRGDSSYSPKLKRLEPKEADRRLSAKLQKHMGRFEIAERLRTATLAKLPKESPWSRTVDQARVYSQLQSFLVQEVPANEPDYNLVGELGADAIVEFVIEDYGIHSEDGGAQAYLVGYGRMFRIDGGKELWRRAFRVDMLDEDGFGRLDPFRVAKDRELWRDTMGIMLDAVAAQFAQDLNPPDRRGGAALPSGSEELEEGDDVQTPEKSTDGADELPEGELPDPDPI